MADVSIKYKGSTIAEMNATGSKTCQTSGKYCDGDIVVEYTDHEKPTQSKTVTPNAAGFTVTPDTGKVLSSVVVEGDADLVSANVRDGVNIFGVTGTMKAKESVSWHQCQEAVRNYLANVTYDPSDTTTSLVMDYAPATPPEDHSNSKPIGETVDGVTYYNEVPNKNTPFSSTNVAGTLTPIDMLRWINCPTSTNYNVRDLGGRVCDGGTVKYGKMIRGGQCGVYDRDALVNQCGIQIDLSLRGTEVTPASPLGDGVEVFWPSLNQNSWWYANIFDSRYTEYVRSALRVAFNGAIYNRPIYFHCASGLDRTGTFACVIEAILGVSRSDIDKDYELSRFAYGASSEKLRTSTDWQALVTGFDAFSGSTFRDKVINWVASLGFTAAEINDFRSAMIEGTPATVTPSISTFTVTNALTYVTTDNVSVTATEFQPYEAKIEPLNGYVIDNVVVTVGGVDVTAQCFKGTETQIRFGVSATLSNCSISNAPKSIINGQSFGVFVIPDSGYTMEGATVSITMGGIDVSSYYSNGAIAIPNVSGNIVITATAVPTVLPYTNQIPISQNLDGMIYNSIGYKDGYRWNSSGAEATNSGTFTTGRIAIVAGDVVRMKNCSVASYCVLINSSEGTTRYSESDMKTNAAFKDWVLDGDGNLIQFTVNNSGWGGTVRNIMFTLKGTGANAILTVNEEIV